MMFKIYNSDFGIKYNGVAYDFSNVAEVQIEDPERNRLTRGANASDKAGLAYKDGLKEPKRITIPILNMTAALKGVLDEVFETQARVEWYCIDRTEGSSKIGKNAVLSNRPQQLVLDESAESLNVSLEFETFDLVETHKS